MFNEFAFSLMFIVKALGVRDVAEATNILQSNCWVERGN